MQEDLLSKIQHMDEQRKDYKQEAHVFRQEIKNDMEKIHNKIDKQNEDFNMKFDKIVEMFKKEYVAKVERDPYKKIITGLVSVVLISVVGAILKLVIL